MAPSIAAVALLLASFTPLTVAQQGVLVNGNSQLPSCATGCQALQQAATACPGALNAANQASWVCFCQSAYLTGLKTPGTAATVCNTACTDTTDAAQIGTWYNSNCGSDFGASEHPDTGAAAPASGATTTAPAAGPSSSPAVSTAPAATQSAAFGGESSGSNFSAGNTHQTGTTWWHNHYQWIIMLIVLAIGLPLLAVFAIWLKRRYDRKQDQAREGFNAGITHRSPGPMSDPSLNASGALGSAAIDGSGRNSPARTRDAFMPYGYGYNRSESRLGSKQAVYEDRRSPLARGDTPFDAEKDAGMGVDETSDAATGKKKPKRVLVRERSVEDSIESEKR